MAPLPFGRGSSLYGRIGGERTIKEMALRAVSAQSTTYAAFSLGQSIGLPACLFTLRQYCAQVASSESVSPTVNSEGGNVTPNAIGPSIEINRNSLPSLDSREIPSDPIDPSTPSSSAANITRRSILTRLPVPVHTTSTNTTAPLSFHPRRPRTPRSVQLPVQTHAHVRSLYTPSSASENQLHAELIKYNEHTCYREDQGTTYRDLIIREWPIQIAEMSIPRKEQPGSPELAPPPSQFSLGGVKSSLDGLVRGNKPESLNIGKQETAKSEAELKKRSGIMSPTITINEKEEEFIGSVDQGTTSSRFIIFNAQGEPVASHQLDCNNIYPQSG